MARRGAAVTVELHLVRHARAAERGPAYPDDDLRPLVEKGEAQASALARAWERLGVDVDVLATSPWARARSTADALRGRARSLHVLDALAQGDPASCARALADLASRAVPDAGEGATTGGAAADAGPVTLTLAAVGHEPWLGALASWLLAGDPWTVRMRFRKAAVLTLTGELRPAGMALEGLLSARVVKALLRPT